MSAPKAGPWFAKKNGKYDNSRNTWTVEDEEARHSGCAPITLEDGTIVAFAVESDYNDHGLDVDEIAELIAAAPDHALFGAAVCAGKARWEAWSGNDGRGEVCVGGMRYATNLDEFGMPVLYDAIRAAIAKARGEA